MTQYAAFRRQAVQQQFAQQLQTIAIPAPTRGIVQSENQAYMAPGGALIQDNWAPTMRGVKLRGGTIRWCDLHALDATVPPVPSPLRKPVISAFELVHGADVHRMFAAQADKLFEVTTNTPVLVKGGQASGNYAFAQLANAGGDFGIAVNDAGDFPLRFSVPADSWSVLDPALGPPVDGPPVITYPLWAVGVTQARGLTYVWKYRNRLFFIQGGTMDAWFLPLNAVGGELGYVPLSGAASKGGELLFGATWSIDAGDGINDKCVFVTTLGEVIIFSGNDPGDADNWRQEGRYEVSPPLGMNAHIAVGGDLLLLTVSGIVPLSQAITKDAGQLELALITRSIKPLWREQVSAFRNQPWTAKKWDEYGGLFVTFPGGSPGKRYCAMANNVTGAWCRFSIGAMCFIRMREDMFFGTQDGLIMQMERTGYDDGEPYVATLVGGWEMFGAPSNEITWHQARASFTSTNSQPFIPQLAATVDYEIIVPDPPPAGLDRDPAGVWDEGLWDTTSHVATDPEWATHAKWDEPSSPIVAPVRNTLWVSIGMTGFAHAPIVQTTIAQQAKPNVELIVIAATFERAGVNV